MKEIDNPELHTIYDLLAENPVESLIDMEEYPVKLLSIFHRHTQFCEYFYIEFDSRLLTYFTTFKD